MAQTGIYNRPAFFRLEVDDDQKNFDTLINESSFRIRLAPSAEFLDLMERHVFTRRGEYTWSKHINDDDFHHITGFIAEYSEDFTPFTLFSSESRVKNLHHMYAGLYDNTPHLIVRRIIGTGMVDAQAFLKSAQGGQGGQSAVMRTLSDSQFRYNALVQRQRGHVAALRDEYIRLALDHQLQNMEGYRYNQRGFVELPWMKKQLSPAVFYVYVKNNNLWVQMFINPQMTGKDPEYVPYVDEVSPVTKNTLEEDIQSLKKQISGRAATAAYADDRFRPRWEVTHTIDVLDRFLEDYWDEEGSQLGLDLLRKASGMYTAGYAPGKPAQAYLTRGSDVQESCGIRLGRGVSKNVSIQRIINAAERTEDTEFSIHPSLYDIVNMNKAKHYTRDPRLLSFQREAVGLHLSTDIGYLNASDPGLGKSVMQLSAMRERAADIENYRGLIISEANVRDQWKEYAEVWFPDAHVVALKSSSARQKAALLDALSREGPVIILTSYALASSVLEAQEAKEARQKALKTMDMSAMMAFFAEQLEEETTFGEYLLRTRWHDICADEAVSIRNGGSKQAKAMWLLRENSDVAVALTGTPVNKSPDDMAKLLEWVRRDKRLFEGHKLSVEYDTESLQGATELFNDLTPLVFRKERTEVSEEMEQSEQVQNIPSMSTPKSVLLKPNAAEKELAHAAEKELKRVYLELVEALETVEAENGGAEQVREAKEQLAAAQNQWLGGTQLARMATSDPESIKNSSSVGASLLMGQGLVDNALVETPTKRRVFIERAQEHIENGESLLVFTDFATVATSLVEHLEANGIRAAAFTGKNRNQRDTFRRDFQNGDLDVLVCTKAAERGLTLHRASAVYHYDLPWTIERLLQRMGRAIRVGAQNEKVDVYFMLLEDTIEERVAQQVLSQGTSASMILDASRGIDVSKTGLGEVMSGMMSSSKSLASRRGALEFGKALNLV